MQQHTDPLKKLHPAIEAAFNKAIAFYKKNDVEKSIAGYRVVLNAAPEYAPAWLNLGVVLRRQGNFEAAASCAKRAMELVPENAGYLTNYANCLVDLDRLEEALEIHTEAARRKPDDFLIRRNYSIALREAGRFEEALMFLKSLHVMQPNDVSILWEKALTYLQLGDYKQGWKEFEIRWKLPGMQERICTKAKRWYGEDISGKTLLIYDEQGLGDGILCSRYIPLIHVRGGRVVIECAKPLHRLFSTIPGVSKIAEKGQITDEFDYHVPMMSLPGIFNTDLSSIPPVPPLYAALTPPPEAARLLQLGGNLFKVGIVWSGSLTFANNRKRAVEAKRFLPLTEISGVQLYSLQKGELERDLQQRGMQHIIHDLGPHLNDFSETAATIKELDLIIMTDSSVAHLAGSLDVPVWNLLCYRPYWLYLTDREDCPWYPSMRLFRQPAPGDWDSVFKRVAKELEKAAAAKKKAASNVPPLRRKKVG